MGPYHRFDRPTRDAETELGEQGPKNNGKLDYWVGQNGKARDFGLWSFAATSGPNERSFLERWNFDAITRRKEIEKQAKWIDEQAKTLRDGSSDGRVWELIRSLPDTDQ